MLTELFTKALQRDLLVKVCEFIMGWKYMDTLHMGPPSIKERVVNVDKVESIKKEDDSSIKAEKKYGIEIFIRRYSHQ